MSGGTRVYLGKLHFDTRERDIEKFFRDYGKIRDINMKGGYAFIDFEDHRDADDAVHELDGKELLGERVIVELSHGGKGGRRDDRGGGRRDDRGGSYRGGDRGYGGGGGGGGGGGSSGNYRNSLFERPFNTKHRIIVEGISSSTDWRDLKDFFRRVAEVTFADAHRFRDGEGVADFRSRDDLRRAIKELDDTKINGRRVRLSEDKGSRSRSRSRSRSPRSPRRSNRTRSKSRDKKSTSRDRKSTSRDKKSRSRDRKSTSRDKKSRSRDRKSRSRDRKSTSRDKKSKSRDRKSRSTERKSKSAERKSRSPENGEDLKEADTFERSKSRSKSPEKKEVKEEETEMADNSVPAEPADNATSGEPAEAAVPGEIADGSVPAGEEGIKEENE